MRPVTGLCPRRSLSISLRRNCIFHSLLVSSSSGLSTSLFLLLGSPLSIQRLPLRCHPPRLFPLLPARGRGRNYERFSPPSHLQVGCVFGQHWCVWQSFSANEWTVALLRDGYRVPFHHFPPVLVEPQETPSCSPGSVRALALREEIAKMLLKGALEPVDQPSLGFYSRLFLAEKVTGGWQPIICLSVLNSFVTLTKFQMQVVVSVLGSIRKGDWMFLIDLKNAYFQIPVLPESWPYLRFSLERRVYQFHALCLVCPLPPKCSPESSH